MACNKRRLILIIPIIAVLVFATFNYAYAIDNNCMIIVWNFFQLPIALGCIEDRLDTLENAPVGSEELNDLLDVEISSVATGDVLRYNGTFWVNCNSESFPEEICISIDDLDDVFTSGISDEQLLRFDSSIGTWTNVFMNNRLACSVYESITKTNLATTYVDVYTSTFSNENFCRMEITNSVTGRLVLLYDFVGAGTDQVRIVDVNNNANVLVETSTFSVDCDPCVTIFTIPSWAKSVSSFTIELQAKSSNGTNDPIVRGYALLIN